MPYSTPLPDGLFRPGPKPTSMNKEVFRLEALVTASALLVSGVAAGSAAYQAHLVSEQFSATVWPYLNFDRSASRNTGSPSSAFGGYVIDVHNEGIGPALIRSVTITRDGKPVSAPSDLSNSALGVAMAPDRAAAIADIKRTSAKGNIRLDTSSLDRGDVISAGERVTLAHASGPFITQRLLASRPRIDISICYCSLLGRCWLERMNDTANEPHDVRGCES
jgi:hypothetical protein